MSREYLQTIPCPPPTETWHPIPHIQLVNEVERALVASKMQIINEAYGVTHDNLRMFGLLQVGLPDKPEGDYAYVVGLRGSLDKSLSRGIAAGSSVFVCDNLAFSSEIVFHRRQTKLILSTLPVMVDTAIGLLSQRWNNQEKQINAYKRTTLDEKDAAHALVSMAGDVFPEQRLMEIWNEFLKPRHSEFGQNSVWSFFNAVTEFLKPKADSKASGLWTMPARTSRLHKVCDDFAGLVIDVNDATPAEVAAAGVVAPNVDPTAVVAVA